MSIFNMDNVFCQFKIKIIFFKIMLDKMTLDNFLRIMLEILSLKIDSLHKILKLAW